MNQYRGIRDWYIYCLSANGVPVYVGCSVNVKRRFTEHLHSLVHEHGRDAVSVDVLEKVHGTHHQATERESYWMVKKRTLAKFGTGGINRHISRRLVPCPKCGHAFNPHQQRGKA